MLKEIKTAKLDDLICKQTATEQTVDGQEVNFDDTGRPYIWRVVENNNLSPEDTQEVFIEYLD